MRRLSHYQRAPIEAYKVTCHHPSTNATVLIDVARGEGWISSRGSGKRCICEMFVVLIIVICVMLHPRLALINSAV
jgi:hypothetical protein